MAQQELAAMLRPHPGGGYSQFDQVYHVSDFVYVKPATKDGRYEIAQITKIKAMEKPAIVSIIYFGRYDDFIRKKRPQSTLVLDEVGPAMAERQTPYIISLAPTIQNMQKRQGRFRRS
jgi:hypothetical protein